MGASNSTVVEVGRGHVYTIVYSIAVAAVVVVIVVIVVVYYYRLLYYSTRRERKVLSILPTGSNPFPAPLPIHLVL